MNFFKCLANDRADITDLSSSESEFHKQLPLPSLAVIPSVTRGRARMQKTVIPSPTRAMDCEVAVAILRGVSRIQVIIVCYLSYKGGGAEIRRDPPI